MSDKDGSPDEWGDEAMHPRAARGKLALAQDYLAFLEFARRAKFRLDGDTRSLDGLILGASNDTEKYAGWADARIDSRRKFPCPVPTKDSPPRHEYFLFLDECGNHSLRDSGGAFPVFCLCGVIVDAERYQTFDRRWKVWKARWLGSPLVQVHEPDVRRRSNKFHDDDPAREQALIDALNAQLTDLDFTCIAAVIDKRRFAELYPAGAVDDFLPSSAYLMCVDFLLERFVHYLHHAVGDARGVVIAESRGLREDAEVLSEFLRLQLEGTQWQPDRQFRYQLRPYIEFDRKYRNTSGLQIADLTARPIAEKVLEPSSSPERWDVALAKLYDGGKGRKNSYGLKVFPTPEAWLIGEDGAEKADESAEAPSPTDQQVLVQ